MFLSGLLNVSILMLVSLRNAVFMLLNYTRKSSPNYFFIILAYYIFWLNSLKLLSKCFWPSSAASTIKLTSEVVNPAFYISLAATSRFVGGSASGTYSGSGWGGSGSLTCFLGLRG